MNLFIDNNSFWEDLDILVKEKGYKVDRRKGSSHPHYPEFIYPLDYGFIKNTKGTDCLEVDIWLGTEKEQKVTGILNIVDNDKKDTEMKILWRCTPEEMQMIYNINNQMHMHAILIIRNDHEF